MAKKLSPVEQKAAMKALHDYRGEAQSLMKQKMHKMKKTAGPGMMDEDTSMGKAMTEAEKLLNSHTGDDNHDLEDYSDEMEDQEHGMDDDSMDSEEDIDSKFKN